MRAAVKVDLKRFVSLPPAKPYIFKKIASNFIIT